MTTARGQLSDDKILRTTSCKSCTANILFPWELMGQRNLVSKFSVCFFKYASRQIWLLGAAPPCTSFQGNSDL